MQLFWLTVKMRFVDQFTMNWLTGDTIVTKQKGKMQIDIGLLTGPDGW